MVRSIVISNDLTELSRRLRKFTFIMPMRKVSRCPCVNGKAPFFSYSALCGSSTYREGLNSDSL